MTTLQSRWIEGKRVARFDVESTRDSGGTFYSDPEIFFEDGSRIAFVVQEADDGGEYGIETLYFPPS